VSCRRTSRGPADGSGNRDERCFLLSYLGSGRRPMTKYDTGAMPAELMSAVDAHSHFGPRT